MKLDVLAIGVHPDDVELGCGATLGKHVALGKKVGILDLTLGEMGTRGNAETRTQEALESAKILGAHRVQLNFKDCFFENNHEHIIKVIQQIRLFQPEIILCNAINDRHPDHGRAAKLVADSCFYSGLNKIVTNLQDASNQMPWRPRAVYHYIQDHYIHPDFVVDVSNYIEIKMEAIKAFKSQFYDPNSNETETPISNKEFLETVNNKASIWGRSIGVQYGEGFTVNRYPGVNSLFDLL
jgi:N-acetylglucosamine malate deacetylase 1